MVVILALCYAIDWSPVPPRSPMGKRRKRPKERMGPFRSHPGPLSQSPHLNEKPRPRNDRPRSFRGYIAHCEPVPVFDSVDGSGKSANEFASDLKNEATATSRVARSMLSTCGSLYIRVHRTGTWHRYYILVTLWADAAAGQAQRKWKLFVRRDHYKNLTLPSCPCRDALGKVTPVEDLVAAKAASKPAVTRCAPACDE